MPTHTTYLKKTESTIKGDFIKIIANRELIIDQYFIMSIFENYGTEFPPFKYYNKHLYVIKKHKKVLLKEDKGIKKYGTDTPSCTKIQVCCVALSLNVWMAFFTSLLLFLPNQMF